MNAFTGTTWAAIVFFLLAFSIVLSLLFMHGATRGEPASYNEPDHWGFGEEDE